MKTIALIAFLLASTCAFAQEVGYCGAQYTGQDITFTATGRKILYQGQGNLQNYTVTYYTTGSPSGLSIQVEGGNHNPPANGEPTIKLGPKTTTAGDDLGNAAGSYRFIFANLTALTGGTAPTVIVTGCFQPGANGGKIGGLMDDLFGGRLFPSFIHFREDVQSVLRVRLRP